MLGGGTRLQVGLRAHLDAIERLPHDPEGAATALEPAAATRAPQVALFAKWSVALLRGEPEAHTLAAEAAERGLVAPERMLRVRSPAMCAVRHR